MVVKAPVVPLGSARDGVTPGVVHVKGIRARSEDPMLGARMQPPTANSRLTAQTPGPAPGRMLRFASPD